MQAFQFSMTKSLRFVFSAAILLFPAMVFASGERAPEVRIFNADTLRQERAFKVFDGAFLGGASVAVGDTDGDGVDEIVVGAGPGGGPSVEVRSKDGTKKKSFLAYAPDMKGGVNVALADLEGDGTKEILTVPQTGRAHVQIFNAQGKREFAPKGFFAYSAKHVGGAHITAADINGDGKDEILTSAGFNSSGHTRAFNKTGDYIGFDIFPFASDHDGGAVIASGNVNGGTDTELILGVRAMGKSLVKVYKTTGQKELLFQTTAFPEGFLGGVNVAAADIDGDNKAEIMVAASKGGGPHVQFFESDGKEIKKDLYPYEKDFRGGVAIAVGNVDRDDEKEIVVVPTRLEPELEKNRKALAERGGASLAPYVREFGKTVEVDLSEQRMYAYENGKQVYTALVSTGIDKYPTPEGKFTIDAKVEKMDYKWTYGPNNPDNYDIKDVKYNLRFFPNLYLHYAYWHNSFGKKRSHGCVNLDLKTAEWIYAWGEIGAGVLIHQ